LGIATILAAGCKATAGAALRGGGSETWLTLFFQNVIIGWKAPDHKTAEFSLQFDNMHRFDTKLNKQLPLQQKHLWAQPPRFPLSQGVEAK
jgi:hypothetical protein